MSESSSKATNQDHPPIDHQTRESYENLNAEDVQRHVEKFGLTGIEELLKQKLEICKDVEINIGVKGSAGSGKSSFINVIRG